MASLLGINFGGQRHSYFQVRITIHELTNVPMVAGQFKAKWRIDHTHNLASAIAAASAATSSTPAAESDEGNKTTTTTTAAAGGDSKADRFLHHKKSTSTLNSVSANGAHAGVDREENGSVDSGSVRRFGGKDRGDDASSTYSGSKRSRKSGHRFLTGLREAFHSSTNNSSHSAIDNTTTDETPRRTSTSQNNNAAHTSVSTDAVTSRKSTGSRPNRPTSTYNEEEPSSEKRKPEPKSKRDSHHSTATSHEPTASNALASLTSPLNFEPRGETSSAAVKDNRVVWDRQIDVGVRIGVEKQRYVSGGTLHHQHSSQDLHQQAQQQQSSSGTAITGGASTPHGGSRSHDAVMRRSTSAREVPGLSGVDGDRREPFASGTSTPRDREAADPARFGMLGQSELRITVKADVPTGTGESQQADSHHTSMRLGYVAVNLAEFAPFPHSSHHHHHHHHHHRVSSGVPTGSGENQHSGIGSHHHHHNHHHHHHHHHHHNHVLTRTETRRYLLLEGPTNATVKLTVEMTHVGGSKDYCVPPNRRGLLVGNLAAIVTDSSPPASKGPSSAAESDDVDSVADGGLGSGSGDHHYDGQRRGSYADTGSNGVPSNSATMANALSDWRPHSVARHSRIPASNLNTTLTHKDTARAVKEGGVGGRLAFSFAAGAHHERSPEDVIEALFSSSSSNAAAALLGSPTPSHNEDWSTKSRRSTERSQRNRTSDEHRVKARDKTDEKSSSLSSSSLKRKGERSASCLMHTLTHCRHCSQTGRDRDKTLQASTGDNGSSTAQQHGHATSATASGGASITSAAGSHGGSSSVRWDDSVVEPKRRGSNEEEGKKSTSHDGGPLSSSPPLMQAEATSSAYEGKSNSSSSSSSSGRDAPLSSMDDAMRPSMDESLPPNTPPDVARREALALTAKSHDFSQLAPPVNVAPPWASSSSTGNRQGGTDDRSGSPLPDQSAMTKKPSRRTLGLSREAALNAGYRGAGWGTLDIVSRRTSRVSIDGNSSVDGDSTSEYERGSTPPPSASTFAYRTGVERTSSPSPLQRAAAH